MPEPFLEEAQDDATRLAVQDMERAGVDVITDGEMRRESYSNRFATALDGVDLDDPGVALDRTGHENPGAAGRRPDPAHAAGRGARRRVPPLAHRPADQDHRPGPVHDDAAGAERPLRRRAQPRARVRGGRQRGAARPEGGGRRRRPDRRAVPPGAPGAGARVRASRRSTARSTGSRATRSSTPASATRTSSTTGSPATRSCASSTTALATHVSLEAAQPDLDPEVLRDAPEQDDRPRRARPRLERGRDAGGRRRADPAARSRSCRASGSSSRRTAG